MRVPAQHEDPNLASGPARSPVMPLTGLADPVRRNVPIAARDGRQTCPFRPMRLASPSGRPKATPGTA